MEPARFGLRELILLLVILAGAAAVRGGYLAVCPSRDGQAVLRVQEETEIWQHLASNPRGPVWLADAGPFLPKEEPHAHVAPGYPWLLSLALRALGDGPTAARWLAWGQAGLGTLTAGLYFLFARRAFHSTLVAALAGVLCALHPFWVLNTAEMSDGVLASFLLAAVLFLGVRAGQSHGPFTSLLFGLALAALALARAALLPFAFVALLWFLWRCRTVSRGWFLALLALLGFANGLLPWTVRNFQVHGDVVPLVDSTYHHLWVGNNTRATGGPQSQEVMLASVAEDSSIPIEQRQRLDPGAVHPEFLACLMVAPDAAWPANLPWAALWLSKQENPPLPAAERTRLLALAAWQRVRDDPAGASQHRLRAGLGFFLGDEWLTARKLTSVQRPVVADAEEGPPLPRWLADSHAAVLSGSLLGMLLLALLGWRWSYGWRYESMPLSLAAVWVPLPYLLSHAEALSGPRLPLDGVLLCFAAFALACFVPTVGGRLLAGAEADDN